MYLWEEGVTMPRFPSLEGDYETEVLIVGGGMAGILCAYKLANEGIDHLLVEGNTIGSGTTGGTTAVLTAQHGSIYTKLVKSFGRNTAKAYLDANLQAMKEYKELAGKVDFEFEIKDSYIYSITDRRQQKVEAAILRELGIAAEFMSDLELPMKVAGGVRFPKMAQMHPLKLLTALADKCNIREHTHVVDIRGNTAYTEQGKITAKKIIVTAHFPFLKLKGLYPLKLFQKRSFVVAVKNGPRLEGTYAGTAERDIYMRNYGDYLIAGGGDCRTGTKNDGFQLVRDFVRSHFPQAVEKYAWAAQDCISPDEMPYIGSYSSSLPDVLVATGFNEWGMTSSMVAASILTDMVTGRENQFQKVFSPQRPVLLKQMLINGGEAVKNLLKPTDRRCSHLGCGLSKNEMENTWDCPCHGSRYDEKGHVLDNPAVKDINL